jgi:hypothetical protein
VFTSSRPWKAGLAIRCKSGSIFFANSILAALGTRPLFRPRPPRRHEWRSGMPTLYFKSPMTLPELYPEYDFFSEFTKLKSTLRFLRDEEQITHLDLDYYNPD